MTAHDPRLVLRRAGLRPKRSLGQNFLVADAIARAIARSCVRDDEIGQARVVEIGAGTGILTRQLAERTRELIAIERDRDLIPVLARELQGTVVRILEGDALSIDWGALLGGAIEGSPRILCGNLPYSIVGPLLRLTIDRVASVDRVVFMVQDEVARRLTAEPDTKSFGALSVFAQAVFDVRRVIRAPAGAFHPAPEVTSAVVEFVPAHPPRARETASFRALVRAAFQARRKTLRNAWAGVARDPGALERAANAAGVALTARGETLGVGSFARMAAALDADV
jgi:16S rRNA (adenine1518-N6/adenine1519-N6)-dimethyltransferase